MSLNTSATVATQKSNKAVDKVTVKREKFEGRTEELSGYMFDVTPVRQSNQYARTVKDL